MENTLEMLKLADPPTWELVRRELAAGRSELDRSRISLLVEHTLWALTLETSFGRCLAQSLAGLLAAGLPACRVALFIKMVRQAAGVGTTLGLIQARYLAPVIASGNKCLLRKYNRTVEVLLTKGSYTLPETLKLGARLISSGRLDDAAAYFDLLIAIFRHPLTYNRSMRLVYLVPRAVASMRPAARHFQIRQMIRLVERDVELVDDYIQGLEKGLALLDQKALALFLDRAVRRLERRFSGGRRFLALEAADARQLARSLQTAVDLGMVKARLDGYLQARTGLPLTIAPLTGTEPGGDEMVASNGRQVLLADPLDILPDFDSNLALAKTLVRLEACYYEFGTFDLDLDKVADRHAIDFGGQTQSTSGQACSMEIFCRLFSYPDLAADLITFFEHLRIMRLAAIHYPGLVKRSRPFLLLGAEKLSRRRQPLHPLWPLYRRLVLGMEQEEVSRDIPAGLSGQLEKAAGRIAEVEDSAAAVWRSYRQVETWLAGRCRLEGGVYRPLKFPLGWRVDWRRAASAWPEYDRKAAEVKDLLAARGIRVYKSDLKKLLVASGGNPSGRQLAELIQNGSRNTTAQEAGKKIVPASAGDLEGILAGLRNDSSADGPNPGGPAFYYPEWDCYLDDYLHDHARVQERKPAAPGEDGFYDRTLMEHGGLVARVRAAFERLKPEGLSRLRPWSEGDCLDYRALIEYAVDRRCRRQASERIFIKRLKQERDVAVLLLVDMSRSTANAVASGRCSVMEVEKQALVVFCEALEVVGDNYAIAGFSGTGPLAVDYFRIKDFGEPLNREVKARISAMSPQRNTRMGAALRHAASLLAGVPARVRLLIVVGDGFPNDQDYKHDYAIADTRKAVQEAAARLIHVRAVTVNMGSDPRLDELYGRQRHYVIEDVLDLPDKLVKVYSTLTRY